LSLTGVAAGQVSLVVRLWLTTIGLPTLEYIFSGGYAKIPRIAAHYSSISFSRDLSLIF